MEFGYTVLNGLRTSSETYGEQVLTVACNRSKAPAATWEDVERFVFDVDTSMDQEVHLFHDSIISGKRLSSWNLDDARKVMMLVDAIYENGIDTQNGTRSSLI
jgi:1,5-anhydro-D-fructose reductase (1,5-anhydro-D-mannitol-forming)